MNCEQVRRDILEAEPERLAAILAGSANDELSAHLARCRACRAAVIAVVQHNAQLSNALDRLAAQAAGHASRALAPARPRKLWRVSVPLALAATIAVVALVRTRDRAGTPAGADALSQPVVVNVTGDRNVTIFKTADPRITVVWYY